MVVMPAWVSVGISTAIQKMNVPKQSLISNIISNTNKSKSVFYETFKSVNNAISSAVSKNSSITKSLVNIIKDTPKIVIDDGKKLVDGVVKKTNEYLKIPSKIIDDTIKTVNPIVDDFIEKGGSACKYITHELPEKTKDVIGLIESSYNKIKTSVETSVKNMLTEYEKLYKKIDDTYNSTLSSLIQTVKDVVNPLVISLSLGFSLLSKTIEDLFSVDVQEFITQLKQAYKGLS